MGMGRREEAFVPYLLAPPPPARHHLNPLLELDEGDVVWPQSSAPPSPASPSPPLPSPSPRAKPGLGLGLGLALSPDRPHSLLPRRPAALRPDDLHHPLLSGSGRPIQMSAPVNVPVWPAALSRRRDAAARPWACDPDEAEEDAAVEDDEDAGRMVPPHLLAARSRAISFSVFEGVGRTLKGRDLREVRNAVLQKTGFLD